MNGERRDLMRLGLARQLVRYDNCIRNSQAGLLFAGGWFLLSILGKAYMPPWLLVGPSLCSVSFAFLGFAYAWGTRAAAESMAAEYIGVDEVGPLISVIDVRKGYASGIAREVLVRRLPQVRSS